MSEKPRNWIVVASADHVRCGRAGGFMQAGHGKEAPLRRVRPGDRVAFYSPTETFRGTAKCQAFTGFGIVRDGEPYRAQMGADFHPFRRNVRWLETPDAPIGPMLKRLDLAAQGPNWGYRLRFGIFEANDHDMQVIAAAMGVQAASVGCWTGCQPVGMPDVTAP